MAEHKQVEIIAGDYIIEVDEGLEDIIKNFFYWGIETDNSCIDNNGTIWISFSEFYYLKRFLKLALRNNIVINGNGYKRETLFDFLQENADKTFGFDEDIVFNRDNEDNVLESGTLYMFFSIRFPKEQLGKFKELFFEVFPPE